MSISIDISVRDAIALLTGGEASNDVCENIIKSLEEKCGKITVPTGDLNLTLKSFPIDRRIRVIQAIRTNIGWGLRESKDFCDVVSGPYDFNNHYAELDRKARAVGGAPNTLTASKDCVDRLNKELVSLGCETHVDIKK